MSIHSVCDADYTATTQGPANQAFGRPKCPRCGSVLLVAEESAFNLAGCIRHTWSCDDCNHDFVTAIRLWPR